MSLTRFDSLGLIGRIVGSILVLGFVGNGFCLLKRKTQWVDEGVLQGNGQRCAL